MRSGRATWVVPVKATRMRLGLLSQWLQPNLRKGSGDQSQHREERKRLLLVEVYKLGLVALHNYLLHCFAQVNPVT